MTETKVSRSFRLDDDVVEKIIYLQDLYKQQLGVKISQADVLSILVRNEYSNIDRKYKAN